MYIYILCIHISLEMYVYILYIHIYPEKCISIYCTLIYIPRYDMSRNVNILCIILSYVSKVANGIVCAVSSMGNRGHKYLHCN